MGVRRAGSLAAKTACFKDDHLGFFVIEKAGVVRDATSGDYVGVRGDEGAQPVPSTEEIVRDPKRCQASL